jgi:putative acetyltransferase
MGGMLPLRLRAAAPSDAAVMAALFFDTVHAVNRRDYTPEQLDAWAPQVPTAEEWAGRQSGKAVIVAVAGEEVVGFAELKPDGHIDCFYTHKDHQGRGVGTLLLADLERQARDRGIPFLSADVSLTARRFFERRGFRLLREQQVVRRGVVLRNGLMEKPLGPR